MYIYIYIYKTHHVTSVEYTEKFVYGCQVLKSIVLVLKPRMEQLPSNASCWIILSWDVTYVIYGGIH